MNTLFSPQAGSPFTKLSADIIDTDTEIPVDDVTVLPDPPNILTMIDGDSFESIIYESVDEANNKLTGVTRGVEGQQLAWSLGQEIARMFTAKDLLDIQNAVEELDNLQSELFTFSNVTKSNIISSTTYGPEEYSTSIYSSTTYGAEVYTSSIKSATTQVS